MITECKNFSKSQEYFIGHLIFVVLIELTNIFLLILKVGLPVYSKVKEWKAPSQQRGAAVS